MLVGIDSYSFHRYFGEVYPDTQVDPGKVWDMKDDFVPFAVSLGVDEVALETCFFPCLDDDYCAALKEALDAAGLKRLIGWGHPDGLHGGRDADALEDMIRHIPRAKALGGDTMRIVASSMLYVDDDESAIDRSIEMLKKAVKVAEAEGVTLALENHIDFTSKEILRIIEGVGSPNLKVNLDTGNCLRLYEDPVEAAERLAPHIVATHTKDIAVTRGGAPSERFTWWRACPAGQGLVDIPAIARVLQGAGFAGSLAIELDLMADPWAQRTEEENVTDSIAYLKQVVQDLEPSA